MYPNHVSNQQYFKALIDTSIVSVSDTKGVITYVNEKFCEMSGYEKDELIGKSHRIFRHPSNSHKLYHDMWSTILKGKVWRGRVTNLNKNGSTFIADSTIIPLFDEKNKIIEYLAIRNDITKEIELQRELVVREQEKIRDEQIKEAEKAFLVIFTHELKTPLNAIINFSKYIRKHIAEAQIPKAQKLLTLSDAVLNNASDMLENITQILEISKLNEGKLKYNSNLFSINDLLMKIVEKYSSLISDSGVKLTYSIDSEVFIYSDEHRVAQILANVLSNAIKYGDGTIHISVIEGVKESKVIIENGGIGIKHKEDVFDLYVQEDENTLQRKGKGTGIGLYYVKLLCNDLNIKYKIEDIDEQASVNRGVRFILTFNNRRRR